MKAFVALIVNDARLLYRSGYIAVSAIVIVLFAVGASRLSIPPAGAVADFAAALVIFLAVISPFLTVGVLLLSERSEGALIAMAVTPTPLWQSLLSRTLVIAALSIAEMFVLFFFGLRFERRSRASAGGAFVAQHDFDPFRSFRGRAA